VSAWLAGRLLALGAHPALLLRGYGQDEVLLHRRWNPSVPVLPDPDRVRAARFASTQGADVVVLDDGFQHRRLARDLDVVLIAAEQPFPGRMLPRGPFREGTAALGRADLLVVTRRSAGDGVVADRLERLEALSNGKPVAVLLLAAAGWTDLSGSATEAPKGDILAVTAVADPGSFQASVAREARSGVELMAFPDHHHFDEADAREITRAAGGRSVAVTEKDAVKLVELQSHLPPAVAVLRLVVCPESGVERIESALQRIARQVRSHANAPLERGTITHPPDAQLATGARSGARA
jgi:tetraacyldisaccharide 4'-kinase